MLLILLIVDIQNISLALKLFPTDVQMDLADQTKPHVQQFLFALWINLSNVTTILAKKVLIYVLLIKVAERIWPHALMELALKDYVIL